MSPRLPSTGISAFVSFYSCARSVPSTSLSARNISLSSSRRPSLPPRPLTRLLHKRRFHPTPSSLAPNNPYEVLGVAKDASQADIKRTYFSLARKYHPDTNPDKSAQAKFVEIQEAYDILKDEKKRAAYDQFGAASQQPGFDPDAFARNPFGGAGAGGFSGFSGFSGFGSPFGGGSTQMNEDLLNQLFGAFGGGRTRGSRSPFAAENLKGDNLQASIGINFMDAAKGTRKTVNITPVIHCTTCSGSGMKSGMKKATCKACHGTGTRTFVIESGFQMASTCDVCDGTGNVIPRGSECGSCDGVGMVRTKKSVQVDIPPGVEDGMTVRIPGAGDASTSPKGSPGDLLVRVNVASSKVFRRQGSNLYHEARIPLHTAVLGGRVAVPTLDGDVDVRVPGGTQPGEEMVLKDRGVSHPVNRTKGDLFVTFSVQLPRSLTPRQREILQMYADEVEGRSPENATTTRPPQDSGVESTSTSQSPRSSANDTKSSQNNDADSSISDVGPEEGETRRRKPEEKKRAAA